MDSKDDQMERIKNNPNELLSIILFCGGGLFSPGMFYGDKRAYDAIMKFIRRHPRYFKKINHKGGINYYCLTESCIEERIGLFNGLMYPAPKTNLDKLQSLLYLSFCIENPDYRDIGFVDFQAGRGLGFVLDSFGSDLSKFNRKTIITIDARARTLKANNCKLFIPKVTEQRSVNKLLLSLFNSYFLESVKSNLPDSAPRTKSATRQEVDEYFDEILKAKKEKDRKV